MDCNTGGAWNETKIKTELFFGTEHSAVSRAQGVPVAIVTTTTHSAHDSSQGVADHRHGVLGQSIVHRHGVLGQSIVHRHGVLGQSIVHRHGVIYCTPVQNQCGQTNVGMV